LEGLLLEAPEEGVTGLEGGGVLENPMAVAASGTDDRFCPPAEVSYREEGGSAGEAESGDPQAAQREAPLAFCAKQDGQIIACPTPASPNYRTGGTASAI